MNPCPVGCLSPWVPVSLVACPRVSPPGWVSVRVGPRPAGCLSTWVPLRPGVCPRGSLFVWVSIRVGPCPPGCMSAWVSVRLGSVHVGPCPSGCLSAWVPTLRVSLPVGVPPPVGRTPLRTWASGHGFLSSYTWSSVCRTRVCANVCVCESPTGQCAGARRGFGAC